MCRGRSEADRRPCPQAAVRTAPELDGNAVAGLAGDLYAASCLVGPLPYAKMPAAILVADDAPDAAGPEALKLRDVARAILAFHDNQLPLFRLGIGLEDPMHGRIIAATPAAARVVFK